MRPDPNQCQHDWVATKWPWQDVCSKCRSARTPSDPRDIDELELMHDLVDAGQLDRPADGFIRTPSGQELKDLVERLTSDMGIDESGRLGGG